MVSGGNERGDIYPFFDETRLVRRRGLNQKQGLTDPNDWITRSFFERLIWRLRGKTFKFGKLNRRARKELERYGEYFGIPGFAKKVEKRVKAYKDSGLAD